MISKFDKKYLCCDEKKHAIHGNHYGKWFIFAGKNNQAAQNVFESYETFLGNSLAYTCMSIESTLVQVRPYVRRTFDRDTITHCGQYKNKGN